MCSSSYNVVSKKPGRRIPNFRSVRGEGAVLYDKNGHRFVNELLPRDVVEAIREQMKKDGTDHVWLSMEHIPREDIARHFEYLSALSGRGL